VTGYDAELRRHNDVLRRAVHDRAGRVTLIRA